MHSIQKEGFWEPYVNNMQCISYYVAVTKKRKSPFPGMKGKQNVLSFLSSLVNNNKKIGKFLLE